MKDDEMLYDDELYDDEALDDEMDADEEVDTDEMSDGELLEGEATVDSVIVAEFKKLSPKQRGEMLRILEAIERVGSNADIEKEEQE